MKKPLSLLLILVLLLLTQLTQASLWGLKADTENRISAALELSRTHKLTQQNKIGGNFVTVGDDSACDFRVGTNKIQNAINSGASEIRIASNAVYTENIVISNPNISLSLRGGFADCTQAENDNQSDLVEDWANITRAPGQIGSIFFISGLPQGITTSFENLKIIGGDGQGSSAGAGIRLELTDSDAMLDKVWLTQGQNISTGGGLSVVSSNSRVILRNTDIFQNQTNNAGGGIYCNNFTATFKIATIIISESSNLHSNSSARIAGGAFIGDDCLLSSFSGSSISNAGKGIFNNSADDDGGGVYAIDSGGILIYGGMLCDINNECFGNNNSPASVYANQADTDSSGFESGGGLYASGAGTDITIIAGHVYANTNNSGIGGAIALFENAQLTINHPRKGDLAVNCWNNDRCNLFNNNSAISGGVIYNSSNSRTIVEHTYFEDNRANSGIVFASSGLAITEIYSSVFNNNGNNGIGNFTDNNIIEVIDNANTQIKYSTFADNHYQDEAFHIAGAITTFSLKSSIVHDSTGLNIINSFTGNLSSSCVMGHEVASLAGTNNNVDDPEFIDRINRNYHLDSNISPAIDYCDFLAGAVKDIDFQNQGFDNINLSNFLGSYDLGADEVYPQNFVTIGGDASCDFNTSTDTIQDAIRTGIGEIRLANTGNYNQSFTIDNIDIKISGGYANCDDAINNNLSATKTSILGTIGPVESIIYIRGSTLRNSIILENLILTGADNSAITAIDVNATIQLNNVNIQQNNLANGFSGGGIFMSGGNADFSLIDTLISQNSANRGGGIYCLGSELSVSLFGNSGVSLNTAAGEGGGVFVSSGCQLTIYSGTSSPTALSLKGISANLADAQGGGIYADLGAKVVLYGHQLCTDGCIGDNSNPVNVNHNRSDADSSGSERGGGIYLTGAGTTVDIYAGLISENISPNGGGIYINDLASLTVARLFEDCWDNVKCNYFFKNSSIGAGTGGAIQSDQGSLNISSTYFEENESRTGSALYAFGGNSISIIEGSVFNHNNNQGTGDKFVIRAAAAAKVVVVHSTFADNFIQNSSTFGITPNSELNLFSSIIQDTDGSVLDINPGATIIDCVMTHETSSFTGTDVFLNDPGFVDSNNRNYHLSPNSLAIDVCDNSQSMTQFTDIDFEGRGAENIDVININGAFDIGADETLGNDIIFNNGFE